MTAIAALVGVQPDTPQLQGEEEKTARHEDNGDTAGYKLYKDVKHLIWRPIFACGKLIRSAHHYRTYASYWDETQPNRLSPLMYNHRPEFDDDLFTSDPDALKFYDSRNGRGAWERRLYLGRRLEMRSVSVRGFQFRIPDFEQKYVRGELTRDERIALQNAGYKRQQLFSAVTLFGTTARVAFNAKALWMEAHDKHHTNPWVYGLIGTETLSALSFTAVQGLNWFGSSNWRRGNYDRGLHFNFIAKRISLGAQILQTLCGFQKLVIEMFHSRDDYSNPERMAAIVDAAADIADGVGSFFFNKHLLSGATAELTLAQRTVQRALSQNHLMMANAMLSTNLKRMPHWIVRLSQGVGLAVLLFPVLRAGYYMIRGVADDKELPGRRQEMLLTGLAGLAASYYFGRHAILSRSASAAVGNRLGAWGHLLIGGLAVNQWSYRHDWEPRPSPENSRFIRDHSDFFDPPSRTLDFRPIET